LSSAVFCGAVEGSVGALEREDKVQTTSNLNLRQSPTTASKILVTIPEGKVLTVERSQGEWLYVEYSGRVGWVHGDYVRTTRSLAGWIVEVTHHTVPWGRDRHGRFSPILRAKGTEFFKYKGGNFSGSAYVKSMRQGTPLRVLADEGQVLTVIVHRFSSLMKPGLKFYVSKDDVRPIYDSGEELAPARPPRTSLKSFAVFRKYRRHFLTSSVEWTQYLEVVSGGSTGGTPRVRDYSGVKTLRRDSGGDLFLRREEIIDIDPETMGALGLYNPLGPGPPSPPEGDAYSYKENHAYVGWKIEQFPWDSANNLPAPPGTISGLPLSRLAALEGGGVLLGAAIAGLMFFLLPDSFRHWLVGGALAVVLMVLAFPATKVGAYQTLHEERYQEVTPYIEAQKVNGEIRPLAMPLGLTQAEISSYRWWFGVDRKARNLFRWLLVLWLPLTIPRLHYFFVPHPLEEAFRRIIRGERPVASAAEYTRSSDEWDSWKPAWWHKNQRLRLESLRARVARETERLRNVLRRRRERGS
jgi:hypothetical protein